MKPVLRCLSPIPTAARFACLLSCALCLVLLVFNAGIASGFELRETQDKITVATAAYELSFTRQEATLTVRQGGRLVLDGWAASGPGGVFEQGASTRRIGALHQVAREGNRVVLDYATTAKDSLARIEIEPLPDTVRVSVRLLAMDGNLAPGFAWKLEPSGLWYGGGFQGWRDPQVWPLNDASMERPSFLATGFSQATPFWYATGGVGVWVRTPLDFRYSVNRNQDGRGDGLLAIAMPQASTLRYDLLLGKDVREVVRRFVREVGYPRRVPPREYFAQPVYTTWVEHKVGVDQAKVLEFARKIRSLGLPAGVIEIDDKWESAYGDMEFDRAKFPDPRAMVAELQRLGFRVTIWVHPFVDSGAQTYDAQAREGLLVRDATGGVGMIRWWNGPAAVRDFTNPRAGEDFRRQLDSLMRRYGIDGFKFDGGDVQFVARDLRPFRAITAAEYPDLYNAETTAHYGWNETRVGIYSQPLGIVQRLIDKHSVWGRDNGLAALVPEAITTSLRGYPFLMPDMVGGNQYDGDTMDGELLIRWAQASALMPLLQFSRGPWHFGDEAIRLTREASELHLRFADYTYRLAEAAVRTGEPVLAPLFYHAPDDAETFRITDQFMLGPDVVVAPVTTKGATTRDLYLPRGRWVDHKTQQVVEGGRWLRQYPAPLDTLPVFVREGVML